MQVSTMPIECNVRVLLAERNLERAKKGLSSISVRELARETHITHSALVKLVNGKSTRIDFETIDRLMEFFDTEDVNQILMRKLKTE
ncbi:MULTISPECIES: helix-turn-helix domain-containing protein [Herpetosiphon]|uniref:helix-turn-helix domain-containing protein n=1 Tax=Herpetosiphon TaxID=64 RepID=UPI0019578D05|nr:helix-turn-helix transcriptional regulator [Herpetosiphon giganteus]MBM7844800.1 DNA-binding Xre family transcriptional regulator [Herpetosiphon giganteus]